MKVGEAIKRVEQLKQEAVERWKFAAQNKLGDYECGIGIGKEMLADEILFWLKSLKATPESAD